MAGSHRLAPAGTSAPGSRRSEVTTSQTRGSPSLTSMPSSVICLTSFSARSRASSYRSSKVLICSPGSSDARARLICNCAPLIEAIALSHCRVTVMRSISGASSSRVQTFADSPVPVSQSPDEANRPVSPANHRTASWDSCGRPGRTSTDPRGSSGNSSCTGEIRSAAANTMRSATSRPRRRPVSKSDITAREIAWPSSAVRSESACPDRGGEEAVRARRTSLPTLSTSCWVHSCVMHTHLTGQNTTYCGESTRRLCCGGTTRDQP